MEIVVATKATLNSEATDLGEDLTPVLSYAAWIQTLSSPARAALSALKQNLSNCAASLGDRESVEASPSWASLLVEIRDLLVNQRQIRDYYTTEQAAEVLGRAHWTVREWCRMGRINAEKHRNGRGRSKDWVISHAELLRIQKEGLLPLPKN